MSLVFGNRSILGEYLTLNKNILVAFSVSIAISAIVAETLSEQEDYLNTTYTLIADYASFFGTFGFLYYFDKRKKYRRTITLGQQARNLKQSENTSCAHAGGSYRNGSVGTLLEMSMGLCLSTNYL